MSGSRAAHRAPSGLDLRWKDTVPADGTPAPAREAPTRSATGPRNDARGSLPALPGPYRPVAPAAANGHAFRLRPAPADWLLAVGVATAAGTAALLMVPALRHWFMWPVTACAVLVLPDAVGWLRGRLDVFDPQALLALLGLHFFWLAPILHVALDYWPPYIAPPDDWRGALGNMAVLNVLGLVIYRSVLALPRRARAGRHPDRARPVPGPQVGSGARHPAVPPVPARPARWSDAILPGGGPRPTRPPRRVDEQRLQQVLLVAVGAGLAALVLELVMFGGVGGFLAAMTQNRQVLVGKTWLLIPAESFPLLAFVLVVFRWRSRLAMRPLLVVGLLVALTVVQFLVGGLRGSRSSTVWPVLMSLILVHLLVRHISRRALLGFGVVFIVFMYGYGLYKNMGTDVVEIASGDRTVEEVSTSTGRDLPTLILGDLGRADIQALVLDRMLTGQGEPGYGSTYLAGPALLVPRSLLPDRPVGKLRVGTDVLYGTGVYDASEGRWATRVYGLAGEGMLNFGPAGGVLAFLALGVMVRRARAWYARARTSGNLVVLLLTPPVCLVTVLILSSDSDNLVVFLLQRLAPLGVVVLLAWLLRRRPVDLPPEPRAVGRVPVARSTADPLTGHRPAR